LLFKSLPAKFKNYIADTEVSDLVSVSNISDKDKSRELEEVCKLLKKLICKATLSVWPADTGILLYMSDQPNLFR